MSIEITMPRLSDTMEQGTIIKWNAKEGDSDRQLRSPVVLLS